MFFGLAMALMTDCYTPKPTDPPGSDRHRFPSEAVCRENVKFGGDYIEHIKIQQYMYPHRQVYHKVLKDAEWCNSCWVYLLVVQTKEWNETSDRRRLGKIKEMIGEQAYYAGQMPPPVPIWYFEEIR